MRTVNLPKRQLKKRVRPDRIQCSTCLTREADFRQTRRLYHRTREQLRYILVTVPGGHSPGVHSPALTHDRRAIGFESVAALKGPSRNIISVQFQKVNRCRSEAPTLYKPFRSISCAAPIFMLRNPQKQHESYSGETAEQ